MYLNTLFCPNEETVTNLKSQSVTALLMLLLSAKIGYIWNSSSPVISLEVKRIFGQTQIFQNWHFTAEHGPFKS